MNDLPCRPAFAHRAVGDERRAREVARVLEDADEQEQQQDLRQEDDDRPDAAPDAVDEKRLEQGRRAERPTASAPEAGTAWSTRVHERARRREDRLEHGDDDGEEDERPRDGMQEHGVEAARPDRRRGRGVARLVPDPPRPTAGTSECRRGPAGRGSGGTPTAPLRNSRTVSRPSPSDALTSATGAPSCVASASGSTAPPRSASSSAMFRTTSVGSPRARIGRRERRDGGSGSSSRGSEGRRRASACPAISPVRTSRVTRSSSERGVRL